MPNDLVSVLLTWTADYGAPLIGAVLLLCGLGVPVPATVLVIAAGAFVRQGVLNGFTTPLVGWICVVIGDTIVYAVGRLAQPWIERRFGRTKTWARAQQTFERRGGIAIYLTRWLLTPLAIPTNLIAGTSGFPFAKFLLFDATGELTWIMLYGGLGYVVGSQWALISDLITNFSGLIAGIVLAALGIYLAFRYRRQIITAAGTLRP